MPTAHRSARAGFGAPRARLLDQGARATNGSICASGRDGHSEAEGARAPRSSRGEQLRKPGDRARPRGAVRPEIDHTGARGQASRGNCCAGERAWRRQNIVPPVTAPLNFFHELRRRGSVTTKTKQRRPGMGGAAPPNSSA